MGTKKCTKCGVVKLVDEFNRRSSAKDGLRHVCRRCETLAKHEYRQRMRSANPVRYRRGKGGALCAVPAPSRFMQDRLNMIRASAMKLAKKKQQLQVEFDDEIIDSLLIENELDDNRVLLNESLEVYTELNLSCKSYENGVNNYGHDEIL